MRFDAYAGNVFGAPPGAVAEAVARATLGRIERIAPRGRYHDAFEVNVGPVPVGWFGHDQQLDTAYFEIKGQHTPAAAEIIRKEWASKHTVSRVDSCDDWEIPGAFEQLSHVIDLACDPRVQSRTISPRRGADTGRTNYWGSTKSAVQARVYEAGKMEDRAYLLRPDWVRAELQVRPPKAELKRRCAELTPLEVWGLATWSARAGTVIAQADVPRIAVELDPPTFERTTLYIARAFKKHLQEMHADFGDWECVGREWEAVWDADAEAAKAMQLMKEARGKGPA